MDHMGSQAHKYLLQLSLDPLKTKRENDIDVPNQHQDPCTVLTICKNLHGNERQAHNKQRR